MRASDPTVVLTRIQRIVGMALKSQAPLTEREAFEQIIEELDLAGMGVPRSDDDADSRAAGLFARLVNT